VIRIERTAEPPGLKARRDAQLSTVGPASPKRTEAHDRAYKTVKRDLADMQLRKCCYCERRTVPDHNDVEHYRPFSRYWWLAWTWANLLFACAPCNRKGGKVDRFPLAVGSGQLAYDAQPPGGESPLLLDPTQDDPREHIHFEKVQSLGWTPIGKTERGRESIKVLGLNRDTYRDDFNHHVKFVVMPIVADIRREYARGTNLNFVAYWHLKCAELLDPNRCFRALSEDVLRHEFPAYPAPPP